MCQGGVLCPHSFTILFLSPWRRKEPSKHMPCLVLAAPEDVRNEQEEKDSCPSANLRPAPCSVPGGHHFWCGGTSHGTL